jgi:hypothetical protein
VEVVMVTVPDGGVVVPLATVAVQFTVVPKVEVCGVQVTVVVVGCVPEIVVLPELGDSVAVPE